MTRWVPNAQRRRCVMGLGGWVATLGGLPAWAAAPALQLPAMPVQRRTLANGLEVLAQPGGQGGQVAVQLWYRVGAKDDPEGRSGFAHLFEHLMFKSTRHLKAEQFDRLTEDVGGNNNAFTAEDVTAYQNEVPSHHLERLLWAEAERMSNLEVNEANFRSERAVVQEEFRQRVLAAPYGRLFEAIPVHAFLQHPYRRPVIGSMADLDAATLDDVRTFHRRYYRPDNAVLIVSGDFDSADLDRWVDRYFAPLPRPSEPVPRVTVQEPPRQHSSEQALTGPNVPLPACVLVWQGPSARSPDAPALAVAQALLSAGDASRLNEALVTRAQLARGVGFEGSTLNDAGYLVAYAIAASRVRPQALVAPLLREIERLARGGPTPAELNKVKTQLLTAALVERQTPEGRATALGWAMIHHNDPTQVQRELEQLHAVGADDVRRVLRQHVLGRPRVTLYYTQEAA